MDDRTGLECRKRALASPVDFQRHGENRSWWKPPVCDTGSKPPVSEAATGTRSLIQLVEPLRLADNITFATCTTALLTRAAKDGAVTGCKPRPCPLHEKTIATHELVAGDEAVALRTSTGQ